MSDPLIEQLMADEGLKLYVYPDSTPQQYLTIGYGRCVDRRAGGGISQEEALYLLQNDVADRRRALSVYSWYSSQDAVRQEALLNMAFQCGTANLLHFPHFLAAMDKHDYPGAVAQITGTPWAKIGGKDDQDGERAKRVENMISTGTFI